MISIESILIILANGLLTAIVIGAFMVLAIYIAGLMIFRKIRRELFGWIKEIRKDIAMGSTMSRTEETRRKYGC